jgi:formaldehyde-activating enzyme involved in methanogenesis
MVLSIVIIAVSMSLSVKKKRKIYAANYAQCMINVLMSGVPEEIGKPVCECIAEKLDGRRFLSVDRQELGEIVGECQEQ